MEREPSSMPPRTGRGRSDRNWRIVVASVLLAAGSALALSLVRTPTYEAEVRVSWTGEGGAAPSQVLVEAERDLIEGPDVADRVERRLGLDGAPPPVRADDVDGGRTWSLRVRTSNADTARVVLDAYVEAYLTERAVQQASGRFEGVGIAPTVEPVPATDRRVAPRIVRLTLLAGAVGLAIGLVGWLATRSVDGALHDAEDLDRLGSRVLATVPLDPSIIGDVSTPRSAVAVPMAFRVLSSRIASLGARVVQVVGCSHGDGATTIASQLAVACAHLGRAVTVVDADLRSPRLGDLFATPRHPGLLDLLAHDEIDFVVRPLDVGAADPVAVIASGGVVDDRVEAFAAGPIGGLLAELGRRSDLVIVDSPAVLAFDEALTLARSSDVVVLVVRSAVTPVGDVRAALDRLAAAGASVAGIVVNGALQPPDVRGRPDPSVPDAWSRHGVAP